MKTIEARLMERRTRRICLFAITTLALGARLPLAALTKHPGHADPAFYYTLATNVAAGRGLVIDYIWHFLGDVSALSHPACDYWPPLAALIMSAPLSVLGRSLFAALLPGVLCGALLALLAYAVARAFSCSPLYALSAALLATFSPDIFVYSLRTEATIYYALIVSASLLCAIKGLHDAHWQLPAFGLAALAPPTRQDGFLLLPVLLIAVAMSAGTRRQRAQRAGAGLGCYALLLLPYLLLNLHTLGQLLPTGPAKTIFLTEYEDLYSYGKALGWHSYWAWGLEAIVRSKLLAG
ncbi:MAG: glycosyltransferase family 39 protein, partial [Chloroflexi bacterium]|nr:glycosyltransferase family 39 protein [Chloroflexota bacterium]